MNIHIETIARDKMRPEVDGADWWFDSNGDLQVRICPMTDWRYEALLGIHEAFEAILCKHNGVTQAEVDTFDQEYDKTHTFDSEAGDDPHAPYRKEHCLATAAERILCAELGVCWETYDTELNMTYPGPSKR